MPPLSRAAVENGHKFMSRQSVLICGLAQNCARRLPGMFSQLEALGNLFGKYNVVVVENDSTDGTAIVLENWVERNPRVSIIRFCYLKSPTQPTVQPRNSPTWFSANRIQRICFARNIYLDQVSAHQPDFVVVVDMDLLAISLDGISGSFSAPERWQAVASNGLRYTLRSPFRRSVYWDTYAYEPEVGFSGGTQSVAEVRKSQIELERQMRAGDWCATRSAFGGLCVYRAKLLKEVEYSVLPNDNREIPWLCEHVGLHRAIREREPSFRVHINPDQGVAYEIAFETISRSLTERVNRIKK